jgi:hypothetical protein
MGHGDTTVFFKLHCHLRTIHVLCGAGNIEYPMPGHPGHHITKIFWGDIELQSGGSVHARNFGSFSELLLEDILAELPMLKSSDIVIVNFAAWYPRFAWQVHNQPAHNSLVLKAMSRNARNLANGAGAVHTLTAVATC